MKIIVPVVVEIYNTQSVRLAGSIATEIIKNVITNADIGSQWNHLGKGMGDPNRTIEVESAYVEQYNPNWKQECADERW